MKEILVVDHQKTKETCMSLLLKYTVFIHNCMYIAKATNYARSITRIIICTLFKPFFVLGINFYL